MKTKLILFAFIFCISTSIFSQSMLILQPGAALGKDALIAGCIPCGYDNANFGSHKDFLACAWTNGGNFSPARGLLEFDLTSIPVGSTILSASLSLYHHNSPYNIGHSSLTAPNTAVLQRVIQPWGEFTVTWNNQPATTAVNQVTLAQSTTTNQNYVGIDVTSLIQDMVNNPSQGYGFMFRQVTETIYRSMLFASSDLEDQNHWPKLEVLFLSALNVNEHESQGYWNISPNPNKGHFTIGYPGKINSVEIYNTIGQKVFEHTAREIEASHLAPGVYFLKVYEGDRVAFKKFVIE